MSLDVKLMVSNFLLLLQCLGHVQTKNQVVEVNELLFKKSVKCKCKNY